MKTSLRWTVGIVIALVVIVGLTLAFIEGRKELGSEREREAPVKTPTRTSRDAGGETVVTLDADARQRVSIALAPLAAATHAREVKAFGAVLDPTPFVALHGELVTAEVAAANSAAQLARTKTLFEEEQNVSRRALDAAEAQQRSDAARLLNAQQRWVLELGDAGAKMSSADREQFVATLVRREMVLARVELPAGEPAVNPVGARLAASGQDRPFASARAMYAAPSTDRHTRGQAFLLVLEQAGPTIRPGAAVTAYLTLAGKQERGVIVPASAVVRAAGSAWAYVRTGDNQFTRRQVSTGTPMPNGWFVIHHFRTGEQVVVTGAQTLLSEELKSQISVGEEAEKR